jgi:hypothetical protein
MPLPTDAAQASSGPEVSPESIACAAVDSCIAVGSYLDTNQDRTGFIETLSSGVWTSDSAPLPANATSPVGATLQDVACPAEGDCIAAGQYDDASVSTPYGWDDLGFIETESGGTPSPGLLVAFGDSVAAGEGDPVPSGLTTCTSTGGAKPCCDKGKPVAYCGYDDGEWTDSSDAYPAVLASDLGWNVDNFAVSGACAGPGDFKSKPKLLTNCPSTNLSVLNEISVAQKLGIHPTEITLTVGADDVSFKDCFASLVDPKEPCPITTPADLTLLEANLSLDFGLIHKDFPGVPVIFTEYYDPLPSTWDIENAKSLCDPSELAPVAYALEQLVVGLNPLGSAETLLDPTISEAAQSYLNSILGETSTLDTALNTTLGSAAAAALIEDVGVTTIPLNFSNHDVCQDYPDSGNVGWLFAPGVSAKAQLGSAAPVVLGYVPADTCATPNKGCRTYESAKHGKVPITHTKWTVSASVQINDVLHPTVAGQTAIANQLFPTASGLTNSS